MEGRAVAPGAGTVLNALATGRGAAFAIDIETTASVELTDDGNVVGEVSDAPDADTTLVERCAELTIEHYAETAGFDATSTGSIVRTESDVPMAAGLKSSSAAANATVLATLDALGISDSVDALVACRLGVAAARDAGVTVTGAFDDASASMLGGVTITDNATDELLARDAVDWEVLVYTPPSQSFSATADTGACKRVAPIADLVEELALDGRYGEAMTVNGFAFCGALEYSTAPMLDALPDVRGVSLSGTGPSYVAVGSGAALEPVETAWRERSGTIRRSTTRTEGATIR